MRSLTRRGLCDLVDALDDALDVHVIGLDGLLDRLVVHSEVEHDVLVAAIAGAVHALDAVTHDVPDLVAERGVVDDHGRVGAGEQG